MRVVYYTDRSGRAELSAFFSFSPSSSSIFFPSFAAYFLCRHLCGSELGPDLFYFVRIMFALHLLNLHVDF